MPYADEDKHRECARESYRKRYQKSLKFRKAEAERKREWYEKNRKPKKKKPKAKSYTEKYQESKAFRKKESDRKQSWYERNREKVIARVLERREELRKAKAKRAA